MKSGARKIPDQANILIAGGGYVGLSCATAIKASAPHLDVLVVDPASDQQIENDERSSAVAADAARDMAEHVCQINGFYIDKNADVELGNRVLKKG